MPVIGLGGQGLRRRWILVATNVESLTGVKWEAAKATLMKIGAEVMVLMEVWLEKTNANLEIPDYHVVKGTVKGRGKDIIMWIRQVPGEQHRNVKDGRHALLVLLHGRQGQYLVGGVNMPQNKETKQCNEEMRQLLKVAEVYSGSRCLC